jgi:putative phosphoribosyl transferase
LIFEKFERYESRFEAGQILSKFVEKRNSTLGISIKNNPSSFFCFCIPNGGVSVAEGFCSEFNISYDILIVRKVKIPYNPEAGFGSVTTDGTVLLNQYLLPHLSLSEEEIKNSIEITKKEIHERLNFYNISLDFATRYSHIRNKNLFLIDDGLASGFTMLAAIKMLKKYEPASLYVSVPTASKSAENLIENEISELFCPHIPNAWHFAVANAYKFWYDVPEKEVKEILSKSNFYSK